ncbi:hypothetical protein Tco_1161779 [Tanacetum coccineum]
MVDTFRRPPKGGAEAEQISFLLSRMDGLILTNIPDRWALSLEAASEFSVKYFCQLIDDSILPKEEVTTRCLLCKVVVNLVLQESVAFGATNSHWELLFDDLVQVSFVGNRYLNNLILH